MMSQALLYMKSGNMVLDFGALDMAIKVMSEQNRMGGEDDLSHGMIQSTWVDTPV